MSLRVLRDTSDPNGGFPQTCPDSPPGIRPGSASEALFRRVLEWTRAIPALLTVSEVQMPAQCPLKRLESNAEDWEKIGY